MSKPKRPRDTNQLAKAIVDISTGNIDEPPVVEDTDEIKAKREGGKKGAKARNTSLTAKQRSEIASAAATARWKKSN